ncbi:ABC transporter ATP-binding protein [Maritimibacter fusiformis]|nr:ABC transporter ATP-binding protein [Maritimibacter fusiformis]
MTGDIAIRAEGLVKRYPSMHRAALDGLSLMVETGEMLAITGPSGSGKSTAMYALAGLIGLEAGRVEIAGRRPEGRADWTRLRAGPIGLVFQEDWLLPTLSAAQNVAMPMVGGRRRARDRLIRAEALLAEVGLAGMGARAPAGLSGGERQRVAIARALANDPSILLADEPTGELDRDNSRQIVRLLSELSARAGVTMVIVTHDPEVAAACTRQVRLVDGRIEGGP